MRPILLTLVALALSGCQTTEDRYWPSAAKQTGTIINE